MYYNSFRGVMCVVKKQVFKNKNKALIFVIIILAVAAVALAYPVVIKVVGGMSGFTTTTFKCTDSTCVDFISSSRVDVNSGTNTNQYTISGSGTQYFAEFDYAACRRPYLFEIAATSSTGNGPWSHNAELEQKTNCASELTSLNVPSTVNAGQNMAITATARSPLTLPADGPAGIPQDLEDDYSADVRITARIRDSSGAIVFTQQQTKSILISSTENYQFMFTPVNAGTYTVEAVTEITDCMCDQNTMQTRTSTATFTVIGSAGIPPTVNFVSPTPADGSIISGTVTISSQGMQGGNTGLQTVTLSVNGAVTRTCTLAGAATITCSADVDTLSLANGAVTITTTVQDSLGRTATAQRIFTVNNGGSTNPTIIFVAPTPVDGSTVSGIITIAAQAVQGSSQIQSVVIRVNGATVQSCTIPGSTTSCSVNINTQSYADGALTVTATVQDSLGRTATVQRVFVVSNNAGNALSISFISPTPVDGSVVRGIIDIAGQGAGTNLQNLVIAANGATIRTCVASGTSPLSCSTSLDTRTYADGFIIISATVQDLTGRTITIQRTFLIDNIITGGNNAPNVIITTPLNGSVFVSGNVIIFRGDASDSEDGALPDSSLVWRSNVNGVIGTGRLLGTSSLTTGTHTITLTATDVQGASASTSITINVVPVGILIINSTIDGTFYSTLTSRIYPNLDMVFIIDSTVNTRTNSFSNAVTIQRSSIDSSTITDSHIFDSSVDGSNLLDSTVRNSSILNAGRPLENMIIHDASINAFSIRRQGTGVFSLTCNNGIAIVTYTLAVNSDLRDMCNFGPTASASRSSSSGISGQTQITFDAIGSNDPNVGFALGDFLTYEWDFGDGLRSTTTSLTTTHTYSSTGTFTPSLRVVDKFGRSSTTSLSSVSISSGTNVGGTTDDLTGNITRRFINVRPELTYDLEINNADIAITKVTFSTRKVFNNFTVVVSRLSSTIYPTKHIAYQYDKVDATISDSELDIREVEFRVRNSWLDDNNVQRGDVVISVWDGGLGRWVDTEPHLLRIQGDYTYYTTQVPILFTTYAFWADNGESGDEESNPIQGTDYVQINIDRLTPREYVLLFDIENLPVVELRFTSLGTIDDAYIRLERVYEVFGDLESAEVYFRINSDIPESMLSDISIRYRLDSENLDEGTVRLYYLNGNDYVSVDRTEDGQDDEWSYYRSSLGQLSGIYGITSSRIFSTDSQLVIAGIAMLAIILLVILIALLSRLPDRNEEAEVPYSQRFDRSKYDEEMK